MTLQTEQDVMRSHMFDLMIEAENLDLPVSVYQHPTKGHSIEIRFDTSDNQYRMGKERMDYRIPIATVFVVDSIEVVQNVRDLFEKVRKIDDEVAAAEKTDSEARGKALAKLDPADKKALGIKQN